MKQIGRPVLTAVLNSIVVSLNNSLGRFYNVRFLYESGHKVKDFLVKSESFLQAFYVDKLSVHLTTFM